MSANLIAKFNPQRLGSFISIGFIFASILGSVDYTKGPIAMLPRQSIDATLLLGYLVGIGFLAMNKVKCARVLITLAFTGYGLLLFNYFIQIPSQAFLLVISFILALFFLFSLDRDCYDLDCPKRQFLFQLLLTMTFGVIGNWLYVFLWAKQVTVMSLSSLLLGIGIVLSVLANYRPYLSGQERLRMLWFFGAASLSSGLILIVNTEAHLDGLARCSIIFALSTLLTTLPLGEWRSRFNASIEAIFFHPEGAVLVTFLGLCFGGALLLNLPINAAQVEGITWIDAAFTAVSAVCVTGLSVLDITHDFSFIGQVCILLLIQLGGLGIMALSSLALMFVGHRFSLRQETALMSVFGQKLKGEIRTLVQKIIWMTVMIELIGMVILSSAFRSYDMSWGQAVWNGLFAAISAFCNAGFFLHSQNMIPYERDPIVLNTIAGLIILGGLSPAYIFAIPRMWRHHLLTLQFRFVTIATLGLLAVGTLLLLIFEWNQTLAGLPFLHKLNHAWFQSVVSRTAGFNAVDITQLTYASQLVTIALMFIGGSPGGTAGGIKTTSFMVMVFTVISIAKGRNHVEAFSRRLPDETVLRATTVTLIGLAVGFVLFLAMLLTQNMAPFTALFEVVSALGTVGLTVGGSSQLNDIGKFLIMAAMFLGRVGPLSVFLFLGYHTAVRSSFVPEEDVVVT